MAALAQRNSSEISHPRQLADTLELTLEAWRAAACYGSETLSSQTIAADIDFLRGTRAETEASNCAASAEAPLARGHSSAGMQPPSSNTRAAGSRALQTSNSPRTALAYSLSKVADARTQNEQVFQNPTPHADKIAHALQKVDVSAVPVELCTTQDDGHALPWSPADTVSTAKR